MKKLYQRLYFFFKPIAAILYPMHVLGREKVPEGACILCPNHSNNIDPVILAFSLGRGSFLRFMAKKELQKVPILGKFVAKLGCIFVDRSRSDLNAIRDSMKCLRGGDKLVIFPEGTRVAEDYAVEAKSGAIRLASKLCVPIVPVYMTRGKKLFHRIHIHIGDPYYVKAQGHDDFVRLSDELMERIYLLGEKNA